MKPLSVVVVEVSRCGVSVEYGLLVVVVDVVVLVSKCGFNEVDIVVVVSKIDVVCSMIVVVFVATAEVPLVVVIDVGLTPAVVEVWVVALVVVVDGVVVFWVSKCGFKEDDIVVVVVVVDGVVVGVNKYGVDANCEDRVSKVVAGVVVDGNMYGVDEVSGEYDSKVDVVSGVVVVDKDTEVVEVDRIEDVVFGNVDNVGGKLVVVGVGYVMVVV